MHPKVGRGLGLNVKTHEAVYNNRPGRLVLDSLAFWEITFEDYKTGEQISLWKGSVLGAYKDQIAEVKFREFVRKYGIDET